MSNARPAPLPAGGRKPQTALDMAHLDEAQLGWWHLKAVFIAGVGFFADAVGFFLLLLPSRVLC
jgi:hypothetical protein